MARLHVMERSHAQAVMDDLHDALGRRLAVSSLAPCPVEFTAALVNLCSTQSCGKCTPCRVGLSALSDLLADVLEGRADESTLNLIERTARTIYLSSDCAIGYEAGAMALTAIRGFRDDFEHHIREHSCGFDREARVPCVSGCPAHVDIPGYISLVEAGRYADAVKVIRKNNPLPLVCGLVCEHPCEMHCRRGMVDDPMNILALKRFAVEHSDLNDHKPHVVDNTGKRVSVIGGGPAGLSCAYYLAVMGHKVTIFEQRHHLGGMLRYGIPSYRFPREKLEKLKFLQSSPKRDALFWLIFTVPGTPKDLLCYFAGLTDLSWGKWLLLCTVGRLPSVLTSTIGGSALGVKDYQFAILVFAVTLAVSGVGLLIYRAVCRRHDRKQQEHE